MRLPASVAARLLLRRGTPLLRTSSLAALVAVALGVASLVVVLALMAGYREALRRGILASGGHVVAFLPGGIDASEAARLLPRVRAVPGVVSAGRVLYLPALVSVAGGQAEIVTVKAAEVAPALVGLPPDAGVGGMPIALGTGLARRLAVAHGAAVSVQVLVERNLPQVLPARVAAVFQTGLADFDDHWLVVPAGALSRRLGGISANGIEVQLADPETAAEAKELVATACGAGALVTTWQEGNSNLFAALRWQKLSLGVLLSLVVGVGAFEVASALVVLVTEKRRQLGVLLALGGQPRLLRAIMVLAGGSLGIAGVAAGLALGVALVLVLTALGIPRFPEEIASIYMVDRIPLRLLAGDLVIVTLVGLAEVVLAALIPARRVGRWEPVEVLRWV